jgi:hypothetical protein
MLFDVHPSKENFSSNSLTSERTELNATFVDTSVSAYGETGIGGNETAKTRSPTKANVETNFIADNYTKKQETKS